MKTKYVTPELDLTVQSASDVIQTSEDRSFQYEAKNIIYQSENTGNKVKLW